MLISLSLLMQYGMTPLHHASMYDHVEIAKALLEKGAATDMTDTVSPCINPSIVAGR